MPAPAIAGKPYFLIVGNEPQTQSSVDKAPATAPEMVSLSGRTKTMAAASLDPIAIETATSKTQHISGPLDLTKARTQRWDQEQTASGNTPAVPAAEPEIARPDTAAAEHVLILSELHQEMPLPVSPVYDLNNADRSKVAVLPPGESHSPVEQSIPGESASLPGKALRKSDRQKSSPQLQGTRQQGDHSRSSSKHARRNKKSGDLRMILVPPLPKVDPSCRLNPFKSSGLDITPPIMLNVVR